MVSMLASGTQSRSRRIFRAKKSTACLPWSQICVEVEITGKIDRPFLARLSLIEVSHVACTWRHLEAKVGTSKGGGKQWQCARAMPVA